VSGANFDVGQLRRGQGRPTTQKLRPNPLHFLNARANAGRGSVVPYKVSAPTASARVEKSSGPLRLLPPWSDSAGPGDHAMFAIEGVSGIAVEDAAVALVKAASWKKPRLPPVISLYAFPMCMTAGTASEWCTKPGGRLLRKAIEIIRGQCKTTIPSLPTCSSSAGLANGNAH
jgi:hypothetical protein